MGRDREEVASGSKGPASGSTGKPTQLEQDGQASRHPMLGQAAAPRHHINSQCERLYSPQTWGELNLQAVSSPSL